MYHPYSCREVGISVYRSKFCAPGTSPVFLWYSVGYFNMGKCGEKTNFSNQPQVAF